MEYFRQLFWSSGIDLPEDAAFDQLIDEITLLMIDIAPLKLATPPPKPVSPLPPGPPIVPGWPLPPGHCLAGR